MIHRILFSWALFFTLMYGSTLSDFDRGYEYHQKGEYAQAFQLWYPFAEQGDADAQYNLGVMYYYGQGVPKDYAAAIKWYTKAAEQGDVSAKYNIGVMYNIGQGVPQDYTTAVKWYTQAAEQKHSDAQYNLGIMYKNGQGVPLNLPIAYALYNLSAAQNQSSDNPATTNREQISHNMSNQEINAGQALTRSMLTNGITKTIAHYLKTQPKVSPKTPVTKPTPKDSNQYPERPAKISGKTSCNTRCFNGDCYRTYDNGKQKHFQVSPTYNPLNSQWEYNAGPC